MEITRKKLLKLETGNQQRKVSKTKSWFFEMINKLINF